MSLDLNVFSLSNDDMWRKGYFDNTVYYDGKLKIESELVYKLLEKWVYEPLEGDFHNPVMMVDPYGLVYLKLGSILYVYDWIAGKYDEVFSFPFSLSESKVDLYLVKDKIVLVRRGETTRVEIIGMHSGSTIEIQEIEECENIISSYVSEALMFYFVNDKGQVYRYNIHDKKIEKWKSFNLKDKVTSGTLNIGSNHIYLSSDNELYILDIKTEVVKIESDIKIFDVRDENLIFVREEGESSIITMNDNEILVINHFVSAVNIDQKGRVYLHFHDSKEIIIYKQQMVTKLNNPDRPYIGCYYLPLIDSAVFQTQWVRFKLAYEKGYNTQINIDYYAFNEFKIKYKENRIPLEDWYGDSSIPIMDKKLILDDLLQGQITNPEDALFQNTHGRYMIMRLELWGTELDTPEVNSLRIHFNEPSFIHYLPEIYQTGDSKDFLERFLRIMESMYLDIEEKIDVLSNFTDIDCADDKFLRWMTSWVDFEVDETWSTNQVRELLKQIPFLYEKRGTKVALRQLLKIYLDYEPLIIENFEIDKLELDNVVRKLLEEAYGNSPYGFTILISGETKLTDQQRVSIKRIIEREIPAYSHYRFVELEPRITLDKQSYLNINTFMSEQSFLKLDNQSVLPFHSKLEDDEKL